MVYKNPWIKISHFPNRQKDMKRATFRKKENLNLSFQNLEFSSSKKIDQNKIISKSLTSCRCALIFFSDRLASLMSLWRMVLSLLPEQIRSWFQARQPILEEWPSKSYTFFWAAMSQIWKYNLYKIKNNLIKKVLYLCAIDINTNQNFFPI